MIEDSNKKLVVNTVILYVRLFVVAICGLIATRFALKALGVVDFGLYSVLGSVVSFSVIINTIMLTTTNRFIAISIGKNNPDDTNTLFNVCLTVHIIIAFIVLLIALPVGYLYIGHFINYDGDITNAYVVYTISILGSCVSFIGVPYNGLLLAEEKFYVFCLTDVISQVLKVLVTWSLLYYFTSKLYIYAATVAFTAAYPTFIFMSYCRKNYPQIVKFQFVRNRQRYREVLAFSGWVGYGAVATIGKSQGAALLVNAFFNTVMNTALGVANSLSSYVNMIAENVARPIAPQVTKSYAAGNKERYSKLLVLSTKFTFLVMLAVSSPFLVDCGWILSIWIGEVPEYAVIFTTLLIIDSLVVALNSGISNLIFASGNIKLYQIGINTFRLLSIVAAYFVLKSGYPAYSLILSYIAFSVLTVLAGQYILHKVLQFDNTILLKESYIPCFLVLLLYIPVLFININWPTIVRMIIIFFYLLVLIFFIGFSKSERNYIINLITKRKK